MAKSYTRTLNSFMKNNTHKNIVQSRVSAIFKLLKGEANIIRLERETALLMLDVLAGIETKTLSLKEGGKIFVDLGYRMNADMERKTSEDFSALTAEGMLLDEVGTKYGPNLSELRELATRILTRDKKLVRFSVPARALA